MTLLSGYLNFCNIPELLSEDVSDTAALEQAVLRPRMWRLNSMILCVELHHSRTSTLEVRSRILNLRRVGKVGEV